VPLTSGDRFLSAWLFRLWPDLAATITIVRPETLVLWHRQGFRSHWRRKSRPRGGRPKAPKEPREFIRQMSARNPLWGAPRLHGELLKLGFDVRPSHGVQPRRETPERTATRLEDLPAQSHEVHGRGGLLGGADNELRASHCPRCAELPTATGRPHRCDRESLSRMDCPADMTTRRGYTSPGTRTRPAREAAAFPSGAASRRSPRSAASITDRSAWQHGCRKLLLEGRDRGRSPATDPTTVMPGRP